MILQFRAFAFAALALILLIAPCTLSAQNDVTNDIDKLEKFLESLDKKYVDQVETKQIVEEGIRRMLEELDPHSVYLDKEAYQRASEPLKGKFKGIGVRFLMINDTMTILELIPGGAAERSGMLRGDQVIAIAGDTVSGLDMSSRQISKMIKGSDEDLISMDIQRLRPRKEELQMTLERNEIKVSSVPASFMVDHRTGYIKLDRFSATSLSDFRDALDELKEERAKNLILDLRGNGGGYLNMAIKIADEFLEDRKLIVYTEGLHQDRRETFANSGGRYTDGALYLLIDANSASASEILAGAIQDLDRGLIIGRRSYGKGLVQRTVEFEDGSAMRLTISRYYTPTGRSIQRPYDEGIDVYRTEIRRRRQNGELLSADSIDIADSLIYFTPSKRKVYGGGGIIPDVFVPLDTTTLPDVIADMRRGGLFDGYSLILADRYGDEIIQAHPSVADFLDDYRLSAGIYGALDDYASKRGVETEEDAVVEHAKLIERYLMVPMARYIYGREAYYHARAVYDEDVAAALNEIDEGTVKELGLR